MDFNAYCNVGNGASLLEVKWEVNLLDSDLDSFTKIARVDLLLVNQELDTQIFSTNSKF